MSQVLGRTPIGTTKLIPTFNCVAIEITKDQ